VAIEVLFAKCNVNVRGMVPRRQWESKGMFVYRPIMGVIGVLNALIYFRAI
jgi:hypothetical protein